MSEHPIESLMKTAMTSLESLVDVNTIVGEAIEVLPGTVIIPISRVCFGFASGGSEFRGETMQGYKKYEKEEVIEYKIPFGGGAGGTVSIYPVAFISVCDGVLKINPIDHVSVLDKLIDYVPDFMKKLNIDPEKIMCLKDKKLECMKNDIEKDLKMKYRPNKVTEVVTKESDTGDEKIRKVEVTYEEDNDKNEVDDNLKDE